MATESDLDDRTDTAQKSDVTARRRIQRQIEFYLSDANLSRDQFFAQQMKQRADRGIPIELLLNCRRLQMLNATEELIIKAVRKSALLSLSEDAKAVVRTQPVTTLPAREKRTVLVVGIPRWSEEPPPPPGEAEAFDPNEVPVEPSSSELCLVTWQITDWLRDVFSEFGQVLYVQLPHFQSSGYFRGFAFVEFADPKEAKAAANAFRPKSDDQLWFVSPCGSNTDGRIPCSENAWKPRLAAKASFAEEDMLARRYIWRCCSRKNKQMQSAMRQLRAAGYKAPNPFNREYELITIGDYSPEARQKHLSDLYGAPQKDKLCVFRYTTWQFWKSKFYAWHQSWIERMRRKTDELSLDPETFQSVSAEATGNVDAVAASLDSSASPSSQQADTEPTTAAAIPLPRDFVPGTVVRIYWPASLVREADMGSTPSDTATLLSSARGLSLARRIRISLEHHLLATSELLDQIAHVDPTPCEQVVREVSVVDPPEPTDRAESDVQYPVFVRMKTKMAACQLIKFMNEAKIASDTAAGHGSQQRVTAHLLSGKGEEAYCRAIASSMVGLQERRRRIQHNRRQRLRNRKMDLESQQNSTPMDLSSAPMTDESNRISTTTCSNAPKHIIFES